MLIQFFLLLPYRLLSGVVFEAGNEWVLWLMVWVAGTSWIYFVATNADQMWKAEKQIKYLLLPAIIGCLPLLADGCRILAEHFVLR
ncbi:hypothetical protein D0T90_07270 [Neisseria animalis]|uniref:Uncharacterized protein n=2 Tax=Neisseria animalis TaxID=492 RepID=A0A5P3MRU4_NEIAN|nr:hypothetical protein D0T90_07270 [Neisseria animalis]